MELYIIRHGDAESRAPSDFERNLTPKGVKQANELGGFLQGLSVCPTRILSSPLNRALQTAEALQAILLPNGTVETEQTMACGMSTEDAQELLWQCDDQDVLFLVGHEPDLSRLVTFLIGSDNSWNIEMKKASCAAMSTDQPGYGGGALRWLIRPKLIH